MKRVGLVFVLFVLAAVGVLTAQQADLVTSQTLRNGVRMNIIGQNPVTVRLDNTTSVEKTVILIGVFRGEQPQGNGRGDMHSDPVVATVPPNSNTLVTIPTPPSRVTGIPGRQFRLVAKGFRGFRIQDIFP